MENEQKSVFILLNTYKTFIAFSLVSLSLFLYIKSKIVKNSGQIKTEFPNAVGDGILFSENVFAKHPFTLTPASKKYQVNTYVPTFPVNDVDDYSENSETTLTTIMEASSRDSPLNKEQSHVIVETVDQDLMNLLIQADKGHLDIFANKKNLYLMLVQKKLKYWNDYQFLWRLSRAAHDYGIILIRNEMHEDAKFLLCEARRCAEQALALNPNYSEAHMWLAIALNDTCNYETIRNKIKISHQIKLHLEEAIKLNPNDPISHYLMALFNFWLSKLNWKERFLASCMLTSLPTVSLEDAKQHFLRAVEIKPDVWTMVSRFIVKCTDYSTNYQDTLTWIQKAERIENKLFAKN